MKNRSATKNRIGRKLKRYWPLYVMLLPGAVYLIINNYLPMFGLMIAFKKVNYEVGIFRSDWVGLSNFKFIFATNDAFVMFRNTFLYNLAFIILGNSFALIVAIALDTVRKRFLKNTAQVIILLPYLLSMVIVTYVVFAFLSPGNGFVNNSLLAPLGMDPVEWYNDPRPWPVILTIVYLWMNFGYTSILYYSTLIGIDKSLYEAAVMDGAGVLKQITYVTLPCMKNTMIIMIILAVGRICYTDFGLFYQVPMHSGMLYSTTQTIDTFVYRALLEQNSIGRSAAAGFLQSVLGFILVMAANALVSRFDKESALI